MLVTGHVWEDFLITFRFSKNLVEGNGLVFNPGERVQGFTSALNVMVPAIFYAISGKSYWVGAERVSGGLPGGVCGGRVDFVAAADEREALIGIRRCYLSFCTRRSRRRLGLP